MIALTYKLIFLLGIIVLFSFLFWMLASTADNWNNRSSDSDLNLFDCTYFVVITFSTIGYGDLSPKSNMARILTMFLTIIVIIGLMDIFAELIVLHYKKIDFDDMVPGHHPGYTNEDRASKLGISGEILTNYPKERKELAREILTDY